mgnify:CR=1 FL=1
MTNAEKIALLEEVMELEEGTLQQDDVLEEYDEWDSVTILGIISLIDEEFGKTVTGKEVRDIKTVSGLLDMMES